MLEIHEKSAALPPVGVWYPQYQRLTLGPILVTSGPAFEGLAVTTILPRIVLGMGLAYSTISLVVLEIIPPGQEGSATASMQTASVLGSALGTGLGGAIIGVATTARNAPGTGIALVDILIIAIVGIAILTAVRLPGRPQCVAPATL